MANAARANATFGGAGGCRCLSGFAAAFAAAGAGGAGGDPTSCIASGDSGGSGGGDWWVVLVAVVVPCSALLACVGACLLAQRVRAALGAARLSGDNAGTLINPEELTLVISPPEFKSFRERSPPGRRASALRAQANPQDGSGRFPQVNDQGELEAGFDEEDEEEDLEEGADIIEEVTVEDLVRESAEVQLRGTRVTCRVLQCAFKHRAASATGPGGSAASLGLEHGASGGAGGVKHGFAGFRQSVAESAAQLVGLAQAHSGGAFAAARESALQLHSSSPAGGGAEPPQQHHTARSRPASFTGAAADGGGSFPGLSIPRFGSGGRAGSERNARGSSALAGGGSGIGGGGGGGSPRPQGESSMRQGSSHNPFAAWLHPGGFGGGARSPSPPPRPLSPATSGGSESGNYWRGVPGEPRAAALQAIAHQQSASSGLHSSMHSTGGGSGAGTGRPSIERAAQPAGPQLRMPRQLSPPPGAAFPLAFSPTAAAAAAAAVAASASAASNPRRGHSDGDLPVTPGGLSRSGRYRLTQQHGATDTGGRTLETIISGVGMTGSQTGKAKPPAEGGGDSAAAAAAGATPGSSHGGGALGSGGSVRGALEGTGTSLRGITILEGGSTASGRGHSRSRRRVTEPSETGSAALSGTSDDDEDDDDGHLEDSTRGGAAMLRAAMEARAAGAQGGGGGGLLTGGRLRGPPPVDWRGTNLRLLTELRHPNFVCTYGGCVIDGVPIVVQARRNDEALTLFSVSRSLTLPPLHDLLFVVSGHTRQPSA